MEIVILKDADEVADSASGLIGELLRVQPAAAGLVNRDYYDWAHRRNGSLRERFSD